MNKPFDRHLKEFLDHAPELFLGLLQKLPTGPGWELKVLRQETSPPVMMPDFVTMATGPDGEVFIFHLEFFLDSADWQPAKMAKYGGSLMSQYDAEVNSLLILIRPGAPAVIGSSGEYGKGKTRITHEFETVKLWEVSPAPILENASMRHLMALVPALASDWSTVQKAAEAVVHSGDESELSRLLLMLSLKYNKEQIDQLIGRHAMGFGEVLWEGSSLLKDMREKATNEGLMAGLEKGLEKGLAQGLEQGLAQGLEQGRRAGIEAGQCEEARRLLRAVLRDRFPGLESLPEIANIRSLSKLEALFISHALKDVSRAGVELAIREAAAE